MPPIDLAGADGTARIWPGALTWQGAPAGCIGRIAAAAPRGMTQLFNQAADACREAGDAWLFAPMDGDTWHSYRLAIGGTPHPAFAMEPPADPALQASLLEAGFTAALYYESTELILACARTRGVGAPSVHVRRFNPADAPAELARMHRLASLAFARAPLFTPIGLESFAALYTPFLPLIDPALVLFAEDAAGAPLGFLFGLPDVAQGSAPDTAILKTYAALRPGVGQILSAAFHQAARQRGFKRVIHALMHADNASLRHSRLLGATTLRRYALFARDLRE